MIILKWRGEDNKLRKLNDPQSYQEKDATAQGNGNL